MAKGYVSTLQELREGQTLQDVTAALSQLVGDVLSTGKKGKLSLTISIAPLNKGGAHVLVLTDEIKVTPPRPSLESTILYATEDLELTRKDPRQPELGGLRDVSQFDAKSAAANDKQQKGA